MRGTFHVFATRQQGLRRDERRRAHHLGMRFELGQQRRQVLHRTAIGGVHLDVRNDAQHAVTHLFLKAVHHTQHDDERRHPQRNAQHGHARDEGNEPVAPRRTARTRVAPTQHEFVGDIFEKRHKPLL